MVALIENQYFLGVLCFLLIFVPIYGIQVIHSKDDNGRRH
jgi:hypothetical protein